MHRSSQGHLAFFERESAAKRFRQLPSSRPATAAMNRGRLVWMLQSLEVRARMILTLHIARCAIEEGRTRYSRATKEPMSRHLTKLFRDMARKRDKVIIEVVE